jgi:hypothetical protein
MSSGYGEKRRIPLDKIIFVVACAYLGSVVAWLIVQKNAPVSQITTISPEDQKFIAYLQSSLQIIDRQSKTPNPNPSSSPSINPAPAASVPAAANLPVKSPRVVERIYVPVYPQNPPNNPPITPQTTAISPLPPPVSPEVNPSQVARVIPTNDKVKNTLVGVMDLGDQSSALFDNKGITTRISTGEFINGWTLIEVRNQQVILSRNGKTKVVEVGQSF